MAGWTLVDVADSSAQYVGKVLEESAKVAKSNHDKEASRLNEVADTAKGVFVAQIAKAAG
ncbi:MAG: hypothetical protein AAGF11_12700 [Myxococcota bacterium]